MAERKVFSFLRSYYEAAKELTKEEQADFLMAICSYALNGEEPNIHGVPLALFKLAKPNIEVSLKRADAGSRSKTGTNEEQTETNEEQNENKTETNEEQNDLPLGDRIKDKGERSNDKGERKKRIKEKPIRHRYGEYNNVLLSDIDIQKLQNEFPNDWQEWIEKVSGYCQQYHKSYSDYLATIRNWARRESKKTGYNPHAKNDVQAGYQQAMNLLGGETDG